MTTCQCGRVQITGCAAAGVLAHGTAIDLDPRCFPVNRSAATGLGEITAVITRTGDQVYEILVTRSLAVDLARQLLAWMQASRL